MLIAAHMINYTRAVCVSHNILAVRAPFYAEIIDSQSVRKGIVSPDRERVYATK